MYTVAGFCSGGEHMGLPNGSRVAIVGFCTDPRFSTEPGRRYLQFREALRVDYIVPLKKPGFIGLYSDIPHPHAEYGGRNDHDDLLPSMLGDELIPIAYPRDRALHRQAWEEDFLLHWNYHHPCVVGVAGHETCGGFPVGPEEQKDAAVEAAVTIQKRLQTNYNINITVVPLYEERITDSNWHVHMLTNYAPAQTLLPQQLGFGQFA